MNVYRTFATGILVPLFLVYKRNKLALSTAPADVDQETLRCFRTHSMRETKKKERNWEHDRVLCAVGKELSPFIPLICIRLVVRPESYLKFPLGCVVRKFDWDGASG